MAQRLNKKLVVGLTVVGMLVITGAGILMVWSLPGRDPAPAVEQAEKLAEKKDYESASKYYGKAYSRATANGDTEAASKYMILAGDMALLAGDPRVATECWGRVLQNDPKNELAQQKVVALLVEQAELYGRDLWLQVRREAERLIAQGFAPDNVVGLNALGRALVESRSGSIDDMQRGGEYLKKAFDQDQTNPKFAESLALFHSRLLEQQIAEAQREGKIGQVAELEARREETAQQGLEIYSSLISALEKNPPEDETLLSQAWRKRAQFHIMVRDGGQIELQEKLRGRVTPTEIERIKSRIDTHSKQALECLEVALKHSPNDVESLVLAGVYWRSSVPQAGDETEKQTEMEANRAKAKQAFEQAVKTDPDGFDAYFELQSVYMREAEQAFAQRDKVRMVENVAKANQVLEERIKRGVATTGIHQWRNKMYMGLTRWQFFQINTWQVERLRVLAGGTAAAKADVDPVMTRLGRIRGDYVAEANQGEKDPRSMFMKARIEMLMERPVEAIKAFRALQDLLSQGDLWVQTKIYLGQLYLQLGEPGTAVEALDAAVKFAPNHDVAWGLLAQALSALPDRDSDAEDASKRALALNPNNIEALTALTRVYEKQKNWTELERIQAVLGGTRTDADAALMEATLLLTRGSDPEHRDAALIAQAQGKLRKLLHDYPSNLQALRMLVSTLAGDASGREEVMGLLAKAIEDVDSQLQKAGSADGEQVRTLTSLRNSIQYLEVLADPNASQEEKVARTDQIIRQNTDPFIVAMDLYRLYMQAAGRQAEAIQHLKEAYKLKPDDPGVVEMLFRASISSFKDADGKEVVKPDWQLAEQLVKRAVELGIDRCEGRYYHGQLLFARTDLKDNYVQAEREFREALKLFPIHSNGYAWLGRSLLAQNRIDEAHSAYQTAFSQNPRNGMAAYFLAKIADLRGNVDDKRKYLNVCIELRVNDDWVSEQLQLALDEQDPQAGIQRREEVRKSNPEDAQNLMALAELYRRVNQVEKAKEILAECYELQPKDLGFVQRYVFFLRNLNPPDVAAAEAAIRKSLDSFGPDEKSGKATAQLLLAAHMETAARLEVPDAPSVEAIDEAFTKAATIFEGPAVFSDIAAHFQRTGRPVQAEEWLRKSVARAEAEKNTQVEVQARRNLVEMLLNLQDFKRTADIRKEIEAYQAKFDDTFALLAMSEYATMMGRESSAIQSVTQYINASSGPDKALGYFRRGSMNYRRGDWDLAISDLREARTLSPAGFGFEHRILLARCLQITGQHDQAVAELNSILKENRNVVRASEELYRSYMEAKRYDDAEAFIMPFYQSEPRNLQWISLLTDIALARGDQTRAVQRAREAVETAEYAPQILDKVLAIFLQFGRHSDLIQYVNTAVPAAQRDDVHIQARLVAAHVAGGNLAKASETYEGVLSKMGANPGNVMSILIDMHKLPNAASAVQFVREESAKRPDEPFPMLVLAHMQRGTGDEQGFQATLQQLLSKLPADESTAMYRINALQGLAGLEHRNKNLEAARKYYEQILEIAPEQSSARAVALNNLAYLLMDDFNDPAAALRYSEEAARLLPSQTSVLDTLGWNLVLMNEYDRGISLLRRAINVAPTITVQDILQLAAVHHHAAVALHKRSQQLRQSGQNAQAEQDLTEAKLDCRRAHGLLFAVNSDSDGLLAKVVDLGKQLGLTLESELPAQPATINQ